MESQRYHVAGVLIVEILRVLVQGKGRGSGLRGRIKDQVEFGKDSNPIALIRNEWNQKYCFYNLVILC